MDTSMENMCTCILHRFVGNGDKYFCRAGGMCSSLSLLHTCYELKAYRKVPSKPPPQ